MQESTAGKGEGATEAEATSNVFQAFGILAGVVGLVGIVAILISPSTSSAQDQLSSFQGNRLGYAFGDLWLVGLAIGGTPFLAYLGSVLRPQGRGLSSSAVILTLVGIYALTLASVLSYGALWVISTTTVSGVPTANATYEAALWYGLTTPWMDFGSLAVASGILLFSMSLSRVRWLPNWLTLLGYAGGGLAFVGGIVAGFSGFNTNLGIGFLLSVAALAVFIVWAFAIPAVYRRQRTTAPGASPGPG